MYEDLKHVLELSSRIRDSIINDCKITKATLSNWVNGKTDIPFWAVDIINGITEKEIGKEFLKKEE